MCYNKYKRKCMLKGGGIMGDTKTKGEKKNYIVKRLIDLALAIILVFGVIFGVKAMTSGVSEIKKNSNENEEILSSSPEKPLSDEDIYVTEMKDNEAVNSGSLIVVNNDVEYKGSEDDLISMYDVKNSDGTKSYDVMNADVKLRKDAASALNDMIKAFASETNHEDIVIDGGYRSVSLQQELYDAAEDKSAAAKPGFSDYHTGYSIDLGISADDGTVSDFDGKGDYSWFESNCYRFGYILRYPEGKKEYTGFDYRPWHFRYVGKAHAYYISKNNLCLEEYLENMKQHEYTQTHLTFSDDNGNDYEAYYYSVDTSSSFTMIAVPSEIQCDISGNNTDGFVVCFNKNDTAKPDASDSTENNSSKSDKNENTKQTEATENNINSDASSKQP